MRILITLSFLFVTFFIKSQAPQLINYQAVARDGSGNIVTTAIGLKFQIYQGSVSGTLVYEETNTSTPSSAGIFTVHIGGGTPVTGNFNTINWASGPYFLQINIDPAGGTSYSAVGSHQLVSVPYALFAEKAGNAINYSAGNGIAINSGSIVNTAPDQTVNISGTGVTGSYPNYTISSSSYTAGTGIAVGSGSITNTAPDQTVNINAAGIATVTSAYPNFSVSVGPPALTYNSGTKELTLTQGGTSSTATLTGTGSNTISIVGTGVANVTPVGAGSNFTVNVPSPIISGGGATTVMGVWPNFTVTTPASANYVAGSGVSITGNTITNIVPNQTVNITGTGPITVSGGYPNYTISAPVPTVTPPPVITGAGITTVTSAGSNFTVNTAPVNMTYLPGTGVLSYSQAIGNNTVNLSPALTFTNGTLGVGSNTVTIPGTGLWSRPTTTATILSNFSDMVGIGVNAPTTKLHLHDTSAMTNLSGFSSAPRTSLRIHNNNLTNNNFSSLIFSSFNTGSGQYEAAKIAGVNTNHTAGAMTGDLAFLLRNPFNLNERMRLTSVGYLGVGTSSPAQILHLFSSGTNVGLAIDAGSAGRARLGILAGGVDNGEIGYTNNLTFGSISNSSLVMSNEWMRITNTGNVGIGTISPANKLHVNGGVTITDGTQGFNKVLTSDATGNGKWDYPLNPSKVGSVGNIITVPTGGSFAYYTGAPLLVITPATTGMVVLNFNTRYNFNISLASQITVGLYVNTTGTAPSTATPFSVGSNVGWAVPPTGGGAGDIPVSFFHTMNVTAGTTYYIWFGGVSVNYNQSATLSSTKIVATLHQTSGL